jgi:hypothetical protein
VTVIVAPLGMAPMPGKNAIADCAFAWEPKPQPQSMMNPTMTSAFLITDMCGLAWTGLGLLVPPPSA